MTKDELVENMAQLLAGLQVPVSLEMKLGRATPAWSALHGGLVGFGWAKPEDYAAKIREILSAS